MQFLLRLIKSAWFLPFVGALLLSLLVWLFGPLIGFGDQRPLEDPFPRMVVVLVIVVAWALITMWRLTHQRITNQRVVETIAKPDPTAEVNEEVALLSRRMTEALAELRKSKLGGEGKGRQLLYQLPWYIVIGPPGAGKTTALINSGLSFPLAEKFGKRAISGVGGTRNCDWWFSNEAVLIDTAGRYTTQDSHQDVDAAAWKGFLGLLKKTRSLQPINGAVVTISLHDLSLLPEPERLAQAQAVRLRLRELYDELGVRFPVYVLFTKTDLLAGFMEFFADLGREEREQVWGATLPLDDGSGEAGVVARFDEEFDALISRLNTRVVERLQQEQDPARRALIFGFPQQVVAIKPIAKQFLEEAFESSRYHHRPLLRGFYFASGTQNGMPIDRLLDMISRSVGLARRGLPAFTGVGRSYFMTRLLRDVVFGEASLAATNPQIERRRLRIAWGALAVSLLAIAAAVTALGNSYYANLALVGAVEERAAAYARLAEGVPAPHEQPDLRAVLPALDALRALPRGYGERDAEVPVTMGFGLYQGDKLGSQAVVAYRRALNMYMLPRLLLRLEAQMAGNARRPDLLFEALQIYLMLGRQHAPDKERIALWMAADWAALYPGPDDQALRDSLARHLDALLGGDLIEVPLDGALVEQVRTTLRAVPTASRIYALLRQIDEARALPEWRPIDRAGPAAADALTRASGKPLSEGIPGFFTRDGFHRVLLPRINQISRQVTEDSWVLGEDQRNALADEAQVRRLRADVLGLYYDDYAKHWDELLADITIVPFRNLSHAATVLNVVAGPISPLRNLLQAVAEQTKLSQPPADMLPTEGGAGALEAAAEKALAQNAKVKQLSSLMGTTGAKPQVKPGVVVEQRFKRLHDLVQGSPSQLDDVLKSLNALYQQTNQLASAGNAGGAALAAMARGGAAGGGNAAQQLQSDASRMPQPIAGWLGAVARNSAALTVGGARSQINSLWVTSVLPFCRQAWEGRYPAVKSGTTETTLEDFAQLFGPQGMVNTFFNAHLASFVDTSKRPWRWQKVDDVDLGLSNAALQQFERAAAIRDGLFGGGQALKLSFELLPESLDANVSEVIFEIGGQRLSYSHGPIIPVKVQWPSTTSTAVRLRFQPEDKAASLTADGPWALFRVLDHAKISEGSSPDRYKLRFELGGRHVVYELRASSVRNAFRMEELDQFKCPEAL